MKRILLLPVVAALALLTGCATLNQNDRALLQQHKVSPALYTRMTHEEPLTLTDIMELSRCGLSPDFIIYYVSSNRIAYRLSSSDVSTLKKAGVDKRVIDYLLATRSMYAPSPYYYGPRYYYGPSYYPPYPYPYPGVVVGGGYYYGGPYRHGYWH